MKLRYVPLEPMDKLEVAQSEFHKLWQELHSEVHTAEQFADWVKRVPSFGCSCRRDLDRYLAENPVDYDNIYDWSVTLHNWVNVRLGKPLWTKPD